MGINRFVAIFIFLVNNANTRIRVLCNAGINPRSAAHGIQVLNTSFKGGPFVKDTHVRFEGACDWEYVSDARAHLVNLGFSAKPRLAIQTQFETIKEHDTKTQPTHDVVMVERASQCPDDRGMEPTSRKNI